MRAPRVLAGDDDSEAVGVRSSPAVPTGDMTKHFDEFHSGTINTDSFCLELDHILPLNGPGHVEKKMLECVTQVLWDILSEFATWSDFSTVKSQQYLKSFGDHHIRFDFLYMVQETLAKELCYQFLSSSTSHTDSP